MVGELRNIKGCLQQRISRLDVCSRKQPELSHVLHDTQVGLCGIHPDRWFLRLLRRYGIDTEIRVRVSRNTRSFRGRRGQFLDCPLAVLLLEHESEIGRESRTDCKPPCKQLAFWGRKGGSAEGVLTREFLYSIVTFLTDAPLAQLDRALDYESSGQRFESSRARHLFK